MTAEEYKKSRAWAANELDNLYFLYATRFFLVSHAERRLKLIENNLKRCEDAGYTDKFLNGKFEEMKRLVEGKRAAIGPEPPAA